MIFTLSHTDPDFVAVCMQHASGLYNNVFEYKVTEESIVQNRIQHLVWMQEGDTTIGACMVGMEQDEYRIMGIVVDKAHQRNGHGQRLLDKAEEFVPLGSWVKLGVDLGKDSTDWLVEWYERRGYEEDSYHTSWDEIILYKMKK